MCNPTSVKHLIHGLWYQMFYLFMFEGSKWCLLFYGKQSHCHNHRVIYSNIVAILCDFQRIFNSRSVITPNVILWLSFVDNSILLLLYFVSPFRWYFPPVLLSWSAHCVSLPDLRQLRNWLTCWITECEEFSHYILFRKKSNRVVVVEVEICPFLGHVT